MRRTCYICGHVANMKTMKRLCPTSRNPKVILVASLSLLGAVERANFNIVLKNISKNMTFICHSHVMQAAQYLCAELVLSGRRITSFYDPSEGKTIAYVSTADIPPHLVEAINAVSNGAGVITARDVWTFINEALKRYYGTDLWPDCHEEEADSKEAATNSEGDVGTIKAEPGDDVTSIINQGLTVEPCGSVPKGSYYVGPKDIGETEAGDLQRYFLVKGERLLKLFRFCPECGRKLDKTQLKGVGTAAVVRFACVNCSARNPSMTTWESKDDIVSYEENRS